MSLTPLAGQVKFYSYYYSIISSPDKISTSPDQTGEFSEHKTCPEDNLNYQYEQTSGIYFASCFGIWNWKMHIVWILKITNYCIMRVIVQYMYTYICMALQVSFSLILLANCSSIPFQVSSNRWSRGTPIYRTEGVSGSLQ